jgi:hypothetical protein
MLRFHRPRSRTPVASRIDTPDPAAAPLAALMMPSPNAAATASVRDRTSSFSRMEET